MYRRETVGSKAGQSLSVELAEHFKESGSLQPSAYELF